MSKQILSKKISAPVPVENEATEGAQARIYKGTQVVDHDLFKLKVATMRKNISWTEIPEYVSLEHCHMFRTVDSNGKKQSACNPVGGHFHEIGVTHSKSGVPSIVVSTPKKFVMQKIRGRLRKVTVDIGLDDEGNPIDDHTHEVEYLGSERIQLRKTNMEFAKFESAVKAHQSPVVENVREG